MKIQIVNSEVGPIVGADGATVTIPNVELISAISALVACAAVNGVISRGGWTLVSSGVELKVEPSAPTSSEIEQLARELWEDAGNDPRPGITWHGLMPKERDEWIPAARAAWKLGARPR